MQSFKGQKEVPFDQVASAIAPALIATAAGIFVAVEAVILFNFFNQRAARIATELKLLTDEFLEQLVEAPAPSETTNRGNGNPKSAKARGEDDGDREAA
jgi:biopolymer transport protein ExbB/TolQ